MPQRLVAADAIDRLFEAPFDDFVAQRKGLAAELRAAGDVAGARAALAAKKPSRTAWAINQVARRQPEALRAALDALSAASRAQSTDDGESMRGSARAFRDRIGDVVRQCAQTLEQAGSALNAAQARRLGETLRAAMSVPGEARDRLLAGRLVGDLEVEDPFAGVTGDVVASAGRPDRTKATAGARASPHDTTTARAREEARAKDALRAKEARDREHEAARRRVRELEEEARQARIAAHQAETAAARAQAEAEKVRRAANAIEERLAKARDALAGR